MKHIKSRCTKYFSDLGRLLAGLTISLFIVACSNSGDGSVSTSNVSVRFSDAPIEELSSVVITVDQLIFNREGDDIVVDTFTSDELLIEDADTFQIDLLEVQGNDNRLVLDSVELPVGDYQNLRVVILDEDINLSYVDEVGSGMRKPIKVPSNQLKLGKFTVGDKSAQTFVVEFGLEQAMTYNPGPDRYILKPRGVRVVRLEDSASISGTVDLAAIHLLDACTDKADVSVGNMAYLYSGHGLDTALLGDMFVREDDDQEVPEFDENVAEDIVAPSVVAPVDGSTGEFLFSYLHGGDYTLAISCKSESDDPIIHDGIVIPNPADQLLEISLAPEADLICDFPNTDGCIPTEEE